MTVYLTFWPSKYTFPKKISKYSPFKGAVFIKYSANVILMVYKAKKLCLHLCQLMLINNLTMAR